MQLNFELCLLLIFNTRWEIWCWSRFDSGLRTLKGGGKFFLPSSTVWEGVSAASPAAFPSLPDTADHPISLLPHSDKGKRYQVVHSCVGLKAQTDTVRLSPNALTTLHSTRTDLWIPSAKWAFSWWHSRPSGEHPILRLWEVTSESSLGTWVAKLPPSWVFLQ